MLNAYSYLASAKCSGDSGYHTGGLCNKLVRGHSYLEQLGHTPSNLECDGLQLCLQRRAVGECFGANADRFYLAVRTAAHQQLGAGVIPPPATNDTAVVLEPNSLQGFVVGRYKLVIQYARQLKLL